MCPLQICDTRRHDTNNAMIERNHEEWAFSMMRVRVARFLKRSVSPVISKAFCWCAGGTLYSWAYLVPWEVLW